MKNTKKILIALFSVVVLLTSVFILKESGKEVENTTINTEKKELDTIKLKAKIKNVMKGIQITKLYLSGAGLDDWGDELLNGKTIEMNQQIELDLNIDAENTLWDILATDKTENKIKFNDLDFSKLNKEVVTITLKLDENGVAIAVAE